MQVAHLVVALDAETAALCQERNISHLLHDRLVGTGYLPSCPPPPS
jgi:hypothetical protein